MKNKKESFRTGQLVMDKTNGHFGVVQYTYAQKYGGEDNSSLSILWLERKGQHGHESSWHDSSKFVLVPFDELLKRALLPDLVLRKMFF
jgi:hypothetical protein